MADLVWGEETNVSPPDAAKLASGFDSAAGERLSLLLNQQQARTIATCLSTLYEKDISCASPLLAKGIQDTVSDPEGLLLGPGSKDRRLTLAKAVKRETDQATSCSPFVPWFVDVARKHLKMDLSDSLFLRRLAVFNVKLNHADEDRHAADNLGELEGNLFKLLHIREFELHEIAHQKPDHQKPPDDLMIPINKALRHADREVDELLRGQLRDDYIEAVESLTVD